MVKAYKQYVLIASIIFLLDQLTKYFVLHSNLSTTGNLIDITLVTNTGSLFSLFAGVAMINIIFIIVSFLAGGFLIYYAEREQTNLWGIGLVLGGILGNLLDRIIFGAVIDWIAISWWPVFNIADTAIVCGVLLLIIAVVGQDEK